MDPKLLDADMAAINKLIDEVEKSNKQWKMMEESSRIEAANKAASMDQKFDWIMERLEKMMPTSKPEPEPELYVSVDDDSREPEMTDSDGFSVELQKLKQFMRETKSQSSVFNSKSDVVVVELTPEELESADVTNVFEDVESDMTAENIVVLEVEVVAKSGKKDFGLDVDLHSDSEKSAVIECNDMEVTSTFSVDGSSAFLWSKDDLGICDEPDDLNEEIRFEASLDDFISNFSFRISGVCQNDSTDWSSCFFANGICIKGWCSHQPHKHSPADFKSVLVLKVGEIGHTIEELEPGTVVRRRSIFCNEHVRQNVCEILRFLLPPAKPPDSILMCVSTVESIRFEVTADYKYSYQGNLNSKNVSGLMCVLKGEMVAAADFSSKLALLEGEICKKNMDTSGDDSGRGIMIVVFFKEDHLKYFEEIKEEYAEFYTSLSDACKEQLGVKHFSTKGQQPEFEVIVLMPHSAPLDLIDIKKKPYSINLVILQQNMFLKVIRKYLAKKNGYEVLNMVDVIDKYVVGLLKELCVVSPCESVWKHWIGGKANHATHMVVFSQVNMDGEGEVTHAFKALEHEGHNFCSNIHIAYCKNKVGLNSLDNGCLWLELDTICVPRENLLSSVADFSSDAKEMKLSATVLLQVDFSLGDLYTFGNKSRKLLKLGFTTEEIDDVGAVYQHDILPLKVCHYNKGEKLMVHDYIALSHDDFIIRSAYQKVAGTSNSVGQFESNLSFTFPRLYCVVPDIDGEYQRLPALPEFIKEMIYKTELSGDGSRSLGDQSKSIHVTKMSLDRLKDLVMLVSQSAFLAYGFSLDELVPFMCFISKNFLFSLPRPPEMDDLEDKVDFKGVGILRNGVLRNLEGYLVFWE